MTLGQLIFQYRTEHHLSQRQFAMKCQISNGYISMLEKGINPATGKPVIVGIEKLKAIASAMGMSSDELMRIVDGDTPVSLDADHGEEHIRKQLDDSYVKIDDEIVRTLAIGAQEMPRDKKIQLDKLIRLMFEDFDDYVQKGLAKNADDA